MCIPLAALAALLTQQPVTLELYSGRLMPGFEQATIGPATTPRYCDVEDTVLDSSDPNVAHGGDYTLNTGFGKVILIRFGSLNALLGPSAVVTDAKLVFTTGASVQAKLHSVARVAKPWGEGPAFVIDHAGPQATPVKPASSGATWKSRFSAISGANWTLPGAAGTDDTAPIPGATGQVEGQQLIVSGLGDAVADMVSNPGANFGFAVTLDSINEFGSSESPFGKPKLIITYVRTPVPAGGDVAIVSMTKADNGVDAVLMNQGDAPVAGLRATWTVGELVGSPADIGPPIVPGQSVKLHYDATPKLDPTDERVGAVSLNLSGGDTDKHHADKAMTFYPGGEEVTVLVDQTLAQKFAAIESARGRGLNNWVQSEIDAFNDLYLARSRYSISPDGARVRVRLAKVMETGPLVDTSGPTGTPVTIEAEDPSSNWPDPPFLRRLAIALGAPNLGETEVLLDAPPAALPFDMSGRSWFPGLSGGGDTRFEGALPAALVQTQAAFADPALESMPSEPNSLLSLTDVAALQQLIGKTGAARHVVPPFPKLTIISATNGSRVNLNNAELSFFQLRHGKLDPTPAFSLKTGDSNLVILPNRPSPSGLKSPFGTDDLVGEGAFLIRATAAGQVGWAWLKAWQLEDAASRGVTGVATIPIRFEIAGGPVDRTTNRALGKAVADSAGDSPAKLSVLVDGQGSTSVKLPEKAGSWVEVDLNRDWTIAELQLSTNGSSMWRRFKILVYQTGQKPEEAFEWGREIDGQWTWENRGIKDGAGQTTVAYRGSPVQIRYIRIVALDDGPGSLSQISAFPLKQN
jgi:hypothetical protein